MTSQQRTVKKENLIELTDRSGRWFDKSNAALLARRELFEGREELLYRVGGTYIGYLWDDAPAGQGNYVWVTMGQVDVSRFMRSVPEIPIEFLDVSKEIK